MKIKILFIASLFLKTILFAQTSGKTNGELSPIFDISPDNKNLVLSISNEERSTLYIYSLTDKKLTQLTDSKGYYTRPVYSPAGDKIIFLSKDLKSQSSILYSINLNNKELKKLTDGKVYVTEASFLPTDENILYCGAEVITNYSPIARKAPHDIDLYSIKQDGSNNKKLTNFKAYEFSNIKSTRHGDTILCKLVTRNDGEGFYLLSLLDTSKIELKAINNPRPEIGESFYGSPTLSKNNQQLSFTAPYQLYMMNLATKKCEEIWSSFGKEEQAMPIFSLFDSTDKTILFSVLSIINRQYDHNAKIFSFDISTHEISQISIPINGEGR